MYRGGSKRGHYVSTETREKLSENSKGRVNAGKHNSLGTEIQRGQHLSLRTEFKTGNQGHKGFHSSEETKQHKHLFYQNQRTHTICDWCGKPISLINFRQAKHRNHFCSVPCQRHFYSGAKNNLWKGGITPENLRIRHSIEFKVWRAKIFLRDHFTCVQCAGNGVLHPHHIKSFAEYPELRFDVNNGLTLCRDCHAAIHPILQYIKGDKREGK